MLDHNAIRKILYIRVYKGGSYEIPGNLKEVIAWFQEKLDQIPVECRDKAYWDVSNCPHDGPPVIDISYSRLETEEELQVRLQQVRSKEQESIENEIKLLKELKAKHPGV